MALGFLVHEDGTKSDVENHSEGVWNLMESDCFGQKISERVIVDDIDWDELADGYDRMYDPQRSEFDTVDERPW